MGVYGKILAVEVETVVLVHSSLDDYRLEIFHSLGASGSELDLGVVVVLHRNKTFQTGSKFSVAWYVKDKD